jgi:hypothetical protein
MRHYMVCPQNEEMLHKIPYPVRQKIRAEAIAECIAAVEAIEFNLHSSTEWDRDYNLDPSGETRYPRIWIHEAITALRALQEMP